MMNKLEIFKEVAKKGLSIEEAMGMLKQAENRDLSDGWIYTSDDPYVTDHQVFGRKVLLGVTYCSHQFLVSH